MAFQSLSESFKILRHPVIWIAGLLCGLVAGIQIYFGLSGGAAAFYAERISIFWMIVYPFFIAATYGAIKSDDYSLKGYFSSGYAGYFRVLLPTVLIMTFVMIVAFVMATPAAISGVLDPLMVAFSLFFVILPLFFFAFFYDTAAVFDDLKVFECIKKSFVGTFAKPFLVLQFFFVLILIFLVIGAGFMMIWTGILADQFEPLLLMSQDELNQMAENPESLVALLGDYGLKMTALMYFLGVFVFITILLPYKAVFYKNHISEAKIELNIPETEQGEYDEKGRWYKYS
ncbi:hypothetical protein F1737_01260 [Methanoplanus sp. FWC-SCC4]|uniref:Uncharacterized protein n=1 Tax=Methanochimaera problematica TaxID=2609417 RepID=A0AA97FBX0_9EURY|nr:hypothetical protein [Methanoplanus sp. FWC-SCC4]WOF15408.1 hypothetical protein F1737_01260 [Methanoplanus sp. FWC-SCC4]